MSIITDFLKLFKYDPETDGASTFNIKQCLNDNWDKIDAWASGIKTTIAGLVPGTRKINNKALSADVTLTGDDIKTSASDNTPIGDVVSVLGGATTPQAALANLGAGVRPNLLDNAIFIGGGSQQGGGQLPVNQRGQTSYTAEGYTVDRWRMVGSAAKITVQADGIYYEKTADATSYCIWEQKLPLGELEGKELAASVLVDDVCYSDTIAAGWTYSNGVVLKQFFINNGSKQLMVSVICDADNILIFRFYYGGTAAAATTGFLLQAAKLEEGDTQTLAYQDEDGAWQLLPQPESDYATQLSRCQRYYFPISNNRDLYGSASGAGDALLVTIDLPINMRTTPVFIISQSQAYIRCVNGQKGPFSLSNARVYMVSENQVKLEFTNPDLSNIPSGTPIVMFFVDNVYLNAEL